MSFTRTSTAAILLNQQQSKQLSDVLQVSYRGRERCQFGRPINDEAAYLRTSYLRAPINKLSEGAKFLGVYKAIKKQFFVKSLLSSCARRVSRCWNTQFGALGGGGVGAEICSGQVAHN